MKSEPTVKIDGQFKQIKMGLGDAILRLIAVELSYRHRFAESGENALKERKMIIQALNQYDLNLGFDCDGDGIPDDVQIFQKATETSCCRILPHDSSRKPMSAARARATKKDKEIEQLITENPKSEEPEKISSTKRSSRRT
jgi:hypothetical protein